MAVKRTFIIVVASVALSNCDTSLTAEDHGPPIAAADIQLGSKDTRSIISSSKAFAEKHELSFAVSEQANQFSIFMQKGDLSLHAHNRADERRIEVTASDRGKMDSTNEELARSYLDLLREKAM